MQIDGNGGVAPYDRRRLSFLNYGRTGEFVAWTRHIPAGLQGRQGDSEHQIV